MKPSFQIYCYDDSVVSVDEEIWTRELWQMFSRYGGFSGCRLVVTD